MPQNPLVQDYINLLKNKTARRQHIDTWAASISTVGLGSKQKAKPPGPTKPRKARTKKAKLGYDIPS